MRFIVSLILQINPWEFFGIGRIARNVAKIYVGLLKKTLANETKEKALQEEFLVQIDVLPAMLVPSLSLVKSSTILHDTELQPMCFHCDHQGDSCQGWEIGSQ